MKQFARKFKPTELTGVIMKIIVITLMTIFTKITKQIITMMIIIMRVIMIIPCSHSDLILGVVAR